MGVPSYAVRLSLIAILSAVALAIVDAGDLSGQMMGGGRELRGGREAMSERLSNTTPEQRAYLESFREQDDGQMFAAHRMTLFGGYTRFTTGPVRLSESVSSVAYSYRGPRFAFGIAGGPLRFASGDTLSITGLSPVQASAEVTLRANDLVRVSARAPSSPGSLSAPQVAAIESIGTSTLDLSSIELGSPARLSARLSHGQTLGTSATLSVSVGADYEPRPEATRLSYWRGTTIRLGAALDADHGQTRPSGRVEVTRSFSDSLGGANLFQGGGTVFLGGGVASLIGGETEVLVDLSAFYFRPYDATAADVSSRRDPAGAFMGASAIAIWPAGDVYVTPIVMVSREASSTFLGSDEFRGRGWSLTSTLAVDVRLARGLTLTPQAGFATGSVSTELIALIGSMTERFKVSDDISGWWVKTALSWAF